MLQRALREIGWEKVDVTAELCYQEGRPTLQLPWDTWASTLPGADVAVYTDAGARRDSDEEKASGVGLVIRVSDKCWGATVPMETWIDNTTAELLGVVLGRYVVERLRDLGSRTIEQTYDAQAAAALAEKPPKQQKHPLRRALQWSVAEAAAAHRWVKSHQEVSALTSHNDVRKMGNILANAEATEAVNRSAKGQRLAVPLPLLATYGARPTAQGSANMEWRIHALSKWRPPRALHP